VTGGAPGYFIRHFSVAALIRLAESLRASGREWPENATYNGGFFDKAMALCESMSKPVIAAISGTCLAGGFEFALSCDLRIAEDGDYLIGLPEVNLGLLSGAGGTQRLPRTIGTPAALMHILMGIPLTPREAERKGLVHETVSGKALDRAIEIAQRLSSHTPESVAYIKRLVRNATETPLAQGLALERNLFLKLCITEPALVRMRSYAGPQVKSEKEILEYLHANASSLWHPVGTCKMGNDDLSVVDNELRVHRVECLRVIDASIMPTIVHGHTNAPTIMIAEKGADLITRHV
jgi:enoyl-CoA hydratase